MIRRNISLFSRYHPFSIADNRSMQINNSSFAGYISTTDYADVTDFGAALQLLLFRRFSLEFLRFRLHAAICAIIIKRNLAAGIDRESMKSE